MTTLEEIKEIYEDCVKTQQDWLSGPFCPDDMRPKHERHLARMQQGVARMDQRIAERDA